MSASSVIHVTPSYTLASPLSVAVGLVSTVGEATYTVKNLGETPVWCRLTNSSAVTSTSWARSTEAAHALLSLGGSPENILALEFYTPDANYRYVSIQDTTRALIPQPGRVEITRHGN